MFAYLITYTDKESGAEIKEIYGRRSSVNGQFYKLASQFEGSNLRSYNSTEHWSYNFKADAEYVLPIVNGRLKFGNNSSKYNSKCEIIEITPFNWKSYIFDKIDIFPVDEE